MTSHLASMSSKVMWQLLQDTNFSLNADILDEFHCYCESVLSSTLPNVNFHVAMSALFYIKRFIQRLRNMNVYFGHQSEIRLWITALILSENYFNDNSYSLKSWSEVSGFPPCELIQMKRDFLTIIRYHLEVNPKDYALWLKSLRRWKC